MHEGGEGAQAQPSVGVPTFQLLGGHRDLHLTQWPPQPRVCPGYVDKYPIPRAKEAGANILCLRPGDSALVCLSALSTPKDTEATLLAVFSVFCLWMPKGKKLRPTEGASAPACGQASHDTGVDVCSQTAGPGGGNRWAALKPRDSSPHTAQRCSRHLLPAQQCLDGKHHGFPPHLAL